MSLRSKTRAALALVAGILPFLCSCPGPAVMQRTTEQVPKTEREENVGTAEFTHPTNPATIHASDHTVTKEEPEKKSIRRPIEFRAAWVTRWDWHTAQDIERIVARLARAGFNAVYFQVRGAADAYYRSKLVPWASRLTGKLGGDPGWDPLQTAIDSARKHGLELHAWFNACTAWKGRKKPGRSKPVHMMRARPEWLVRGRDGKPLRGASGYLFFNPAIPAFRRHLLAVVSELVSFYEIDGLHLDYIRYPAADSSRDRIGITLWKQARARRPGLSLAEFQRKRLTELVGEIRHAVHSIRPDCEVSAAVFGIWKNRWGWKKVIQGFYDFHQDSHGWTEAGAVDALVPMLYWPPGKSRGARTDFYTVADDYLPLSGKVRLIAGIRVDKVSFEQFENQVQSLRASVYAGLALFSYQLLVRRGWLEMLPKRVFSSPALARPPSPMAGTPGVFRQALRLTTGRPGPLGKSSMTEGG